MQLTLVIDSATASPDDYRRAASTLLHFGLGNNGASLTLDRVTIAGPAQDIAKVADAAVEPVNTPDPATIGFGSTVPPTTATTVGGENVNDVLARIEKDIDGLPHDARIHSREKTKNKDGRWKKRRGVEDAEVARVEAELRQIMNIPAPAAAAAVVPPPPPVPDAPASVPPPPSVAPPAPTPSVAPAPLAAGAGGVTTFSQLMAWVGPALAAGKISAAAVEETMRNLGIVDGTGVGQLALLAARPDLVPGAYSALTAAAGSA